ncbi:uncharacterized protein LOC108682971 isoform X3 [Hyalella azteca]|uniref:XK-related protein n=1 Tax=Hyalella azteca TaxID=294128 RepID=A0A979FU12_HYAAZ|nr:uncharacterized protein LOC108682971 isoform X3 [Hyalella azteca]
MSGSANYKCYSPIANGGGSGANSNCSSNRNSASQQEHRRTRSNTSNNSNFSVTDQELRTRLIFSRAMSSQDSSREALDNRDRDLNSGETVFQAESESCAAPLLPAPMPSNSIVSSTAPRSLAIAPPVSAASVATAAAQTEAATSFSPSSSSRMLPTPQGSSLCRSPEETPDLVDLANWLDDTDSGHPFTRAALCGDAATIKEMCSKHTFDPNGKKAHHALLAACRSGHIEVARVLLDAGVDVHCKDAKSGWQAIHYAAYKDRVKVVELLLGYGEWGARCVALVRVRGVTCSLLHLAAHYGCCAVLAFLLSNNANLVKLNLAIDMRDAGHWTSLHHAVCESRVRACEVLLQAGADVNITDPHGVTALHVAAKKDNLGLFRLLMEHKANPKLNVINAGTTPSRRPLRHSADQIWTSRVAGSAGSAYTGSLERLIPSNRRRRCWSPLIQKPDLRELPAAKAHCLNMRRCSGSELTQPVAFVRDISRDKKISTLGNKSTSRPGSEKKLPPLQGPVGPGRQALLKSSSFRQASKVKKERSMKESDFISWKGLKADRFSAWSEACDKYRVGKSTASNDAVGSIIRPLTSTATLGLTTSASDTTLSTTLTGTEDDPAISQKSSSKKRKTRLQNQPDQVKRSADHGLPYFKRVSGNKSLPGSPILLRGSQHSISVRSSPQRLLSDPHNSSPPPSLASHKYPESLPCSFIRTRPKFSLSGSPPNSPRGSPPVSPFASHVPPTPTSTLGDLGLFNDSLCTDYPLSPHSSPDVFCQERVFERVEPFIKFLEGSTLLHWAASRGHHDIVGDLLARGLKVDARDSLGRTPLGVTMWAGHSNIVALLQHEKLQLTDEDKNWAHIPSEEVGLCIVKCIKDTGVCELTACRPDGFSLLHLAAQKGYPNMTHALVSLKVNPDIPNNQGETPLFIAIKNNQLACVQQLLNAGTKLSRTDNRGGSALHVAAKMGNVTVVDMLLTSSESGERIIDINKCDNIGYTPVYYAINASRYDIVQRFLEYSLVEKVHVKATNHETLLQFFTERNNLGQFDNALVRVLECEQLLHATKASAEMCLRVQLGTTEASTKARSQLQAMYESTPAQQHCWNFWFFLSCFLVPSVFYYLDVYTDILLAVEYYKDFKNANSTEISEDQSLMHMFENFVENQDKTNFVLTVFFILLPTTLLSLWSLYIHVTQADILPIFKNMPSVLRLLLYVLVFLTPLAPIIVYLENTYAQMKHMNVTSRQMQENNSSNTNNTRAESNTAGTTKTYRHHTRDQKIRKYYDLKHVAQMRVAITNVMEATLESAFQLILQLYIVGTHYTDLVKVREVTLGAILTLSSDGQETRLGKQVFSVLISLVSLTWSFTSYHRFSKLGGLTILSALPLLFAIFFQVVSRAIACTMFTLAYTWRIFVVLGVHFIIVLGFKLRLEERSLIPPRPHTYCHCLFSTIRPYFYVFLGTIASTLVYFRLERPSVVKKQLSRRHSTVVIQVLFLLLSFLENFILLFLGMAGLDRNKYDNTFMAVSGALCVLSYFIGIVLHGVYYACFGHPWVDINGPKFQKDEDEKTWIVSYYRQGKMNKWTVRSCCDITHNEEEPDDDVYRTPEMQMNGGNPIRQVKDI